MWTSKGGAEETLQIVLDIEDPSDALVPHDSMLHPLFPAPNERQPLWYRLAVRGWKSRIEELAPTLQPATRGARQLLKIGVAQLCFESGETRAQHLRRNGLRPFFHNAAKDDTPILSSQRLHGRGHGHARTPLQMTLQTPGLVRRQTETTMRRTQPLWPIRIARHVR